MFISNLSVLLPFLILSRASNIVTEIGAGRKQLRSGRRDISRVDLEFDQKARGENQAMGYIS
ncbi:MAG TPA: hypothetical protein VKW06_13450 [Candidatus Angelobacter sp.]|nr:hypothetical protein [Candidatus Angelobacter sp.]